MASVLVVDDEPGIRETLKRFLEKDGHEVAVAGSVDESLVLLKEYRFDVVVSDIYMPGASGVDLLKAIHADSPDTKVILVTGEPSVETASEAVRSQVFDYLQKPVSRARICHTVNAAVRYRNLEEEKRQYREDLEAQVEARTLELQSSLERIRQVISETAGALSSVMELRDPYTAGHQRRVARLACAIADAMGIDEERIEGLKIAGLLHDLGKLQIPSDILAKPSRLSEAEFELVKTHSQAAYDTLKDVNFPWPIADIVVQHHERMDGSGYPGGLMAGEILLESRILAVSDVVEAMASHRPYRPALGVDKALEEIEGSQGTLFDTRVVDACLTLFRMKEFHLEDSA